MIQEQLSELKDTFLTQPAVGYQNSLMSFCIDMERIINGTNLVEQQLFTVPEAERGNPSSIIAKTRDAVRDWHEVNEQINLLRVEGPYQEYDLVSAKYQEHIIYMIGVYLNGQWVSKCPGALGLCDPVQQWPPFPYPSVEAGLSQGVFELWRFRDV